MNTTDIISRIILSTVTAQDFYDYSKDWGTIQDLIKSSKETLRSFGLSWETGSGTAYILRRKNKGEDKVLILMETKNTLSDEFPYYVQVYK